MKCQLFFFLFSFFLSFFLFLPEYTTVVCNTCVAPPVFYEIGTGDTLEKYFLVLMPVYPKTCPSNLVTTEGIWYTGQKSFVPPKNTKLIIKEVRIKMVVVCTR